MSTLRNCTRTKSTNCNHKPEHNFHRNETQNRSVINAQPRRMNQWGMTDSTGIIRTETSAKNRAQNMRWPEVIENMTKLQDEMSTVLRNMCNTIGITMPTDPTFYPATFQGSIVRMNVTG